MYQRRSANILDELKDPNKRRRESADVFLLYFKRSRQSTVFDLETVARCRMSRLDFYHYW